MRARSYIRVTRTHTQSNIGSAAALRDEDVVFAQYREAGVLLWRGWCARRFADQLVGNTDDLGKGRQVRARARARVHVANACMCGYVCVRSCKCGRARDVLP